MAKTRRFGCASCYEYYEKTFDEYYEETFDKIIKRCQNGATKHVGKSPKNLPHRKEAELFAAEDLDGKIKMLRSKMEKAIELENYEVAGVLKKRIEELKNHIKSDF
jgi:protein-arginine kinase activator protein McsA